MNAGTGTLKALPCQESKIENDGDRVTERSDFRTHQRRRSETKIELYRQMRTPNLLLLVAALLCLSPVLAEAPWPGWRVRLGDEVLEIGSIQPERLSPREVVLGGERLLATPIQNGEILSGVAIEDRADSDAWQVFLKDNASFYAKSVQFLESTLRCPTPTIVGGVDCTCQIRHRESDKRQFRITQELCEGDGDTLARTSIEFGPVGREAEAQVEQRLKQMDTLTDPLHALAQARAILLEYPAIRRSQSAVR